jgi:hypothetical protein
MRVPQSLFWRILRLRLRRYAVGARKNRVRELNTTKDRGTVNISVVHRLCKDYNRFSRALRVRVLILFQKTKKNRQLPKGERWRVLLVGSRFRNFIAYYVRSERILERKNAANKRKELFCSTNDNINSPIVVLTFQSWANTFPHGEATASMKLA